MSSINAFPTKYWHSLEDGRLQCDRLPACLQASRRAARSVFRARRGQIRLNCPTTYGRSSGFCVDPIEKKPLNHFLPGTPVLSFGTAGCNLACKFCQNWDMSKSREMDTLADLASPETIARAARGLGCRSMAYTYNDPVIFMSMPMDVAEAGHALGIKSVAVTAGYMCAEPRDEFYQHMDAANVDLKGFTESSITQFTGRPSAAGAGHAHISEARDQCLVRDHDLAHPRRERFREGNPGFDTVDRGEPRSGCAVAFHRFSSGLEDAYKLPHPHLPRRSPWPAASPSGTASATVTLVMCTTGRAAAPIAINAARG